MKKGPKTKTYPVITVPLGQKGDPSCPKDGGTLIAHNAGGVQCMFCKTRYSIHYEGEED